LSFLLFTLAISPNLYTFVARIFKQEKKV